MLKSHPWDNYGEPPRAYLDEEYSIPDEVYKMAKTLASKAVSYVERVYELEEELREEKQRLIEAVDAANAYVADYIEPYDKTAAEILFEEIPYI